MQFSEQFGITVTGDDDWFDAMLTTDTGLYVDPFLIYLDQDASWQGAHEKLIAFFAMVLEYVKESAGDKTSSAWKKAASLLLFPEPFEFGLGHTAEGTMGAGSGRGLQQDMLEGALVSARLGIEDIEHMELLVLFREGIGVDRISDMACNVLKSYFIDYTEEICERHNVPTQKVRVRHSDWDSEYGRWLDQYRNLPTNPFNRDRYLLLTPERFLRPIPTVDPGEFWDFAWWNEGDELRADFNYDVAKHVPAAVKARLARQHPDIAMQYLRNLETKPPQPYNVWEDPELLVRWYAGGRDIAAENPLSVVPTSPSEFAKFIEAMIASFSHSLQDSDLAPLLWNGDQPRSEKDVQALFRSTVVHYCRANKITVTGEANAGRGPVDFKFIQNWSSQALVEIKLTNNSHYWNGLQAQTVQYLKSEEVKLGFFVSVGFTEADHKPERLVRVETVAKSVSERTGKDVRVAFIDGRKKKSASKLKPEDLQE